LMAFCAIGEQESCYWVQLKVFEETSWLITSECDDQYQDSECRNTKVSP
jgi:hypothetical protein